MRRRTLLGIGALGALGIWAARPTDHGRPHDAYFTRLNQLFREDGGGVPQMVIDLDRLDANADLLAARLGSRQLRLVAKSLASGGLLDYLARRLNCTRFMVFHQPQLNQLARLFPSADLLLGKPLPTAAALAFYQQLPRHLGFDPSNQVTWLVDSAQRLQEYTELSRALGQSLQVALEIDIGLARGGLSSPDALANVLSQMTASASPLKLRGLMGYDAQVAHAPFWIGKERALRESNARYQAFIQVARTFPIWPQDPLLNGGGSQTYPLHVAGNGPLSEVAVGSALLKPAAFDSELLREHQAALWIASPVLKVLDGTLPYLDNVQGLLQGWNPNRQRAHYLYGGNWQAEPVSPAGLGYDSLYGRSANQERLIGSRSTGLAVDDWVFLRPTQSEGTLGEFADLRLLRRGNLVGRWNPLSLA
ncbi:alanine racemase [Pseudomonas sp. JS3066]|uniref:alanine racemase n=1 Tax=unclassified Pseudomonas TaxID=196821 RepID=UPI00129E7D0D|nr:MULTISPECIES: alanine racemase [unclassified Pseudomonas]MDH4653514.1 DSD1 family PLP-dependent enzyme [Pseudomonas sp. BN606]MRK22436.1 DSD1 family PLP-dependent enzyme [Pseudomonas sp. JG-B]WVK93685.1 alanine racemase [Pseudomonas sp. JS3066]